MYLIFCLQIKLVYAIICSLIYYQHRYMKVDVESWCTSTVHLIVLSQKSLTGTCYDWINSGHHNVHNLVFKNNVNIVSTTLIVIFPVKVTHKSVILCRLINDLLPILWLWALTWGSVVCFDVLTDRLTFDLVLYGLSLCSFCCVHYLCFPLALKHVFECSYECYLHLHMRACVCLRAHLLAMRHIKP